MNPRLPRIETPLSDDAGPQFGSFTPLWIHTGPILSVDKLPAGKL
jgi:hypothetical protein